MRLALSPTDLRRVALPGVAVAILALGACSTPGRSHPYVSEALRVSFGAIGVVPARPDRSDQIDEPSTKQEAALWGLAGDTLELLGGARDALGLVIVAPLVPYVAIRGAVRGAAEGALAKDIEPVRAGILAAIHVARRQPSMADRVFVDARAELGDEITHISLESTMQAVLPRGADGQRIDTLLEVGDDAVLLESVEGETADPTIALRVRCRVRLLRAADRKLLYDYAWGSGAGDRHRFSEWAMDDGRLLRDAIDVVRDRLARRIVEELLLVYNDPRTKLSQYDGRRRRMAKFPPVLGRRGTLAWGFTPVDPPLASPATEVSSLQPRFIWEPFPGSVAIGMATDSPATVAPFVPVEVSRVTNVTYEFRIWKDHRLIYRRTGLVEPNHRVDIRLEPSSFHQWNVRAWFELDGRKRVSEWGQLLYRDGSKEVFTNGWFGYEFYTPKSSD